jgi:hypothetical protein
MRAPVCPEETSVMNANATRARVEHPTRQYSEEEHAALRRVSTEMGAEAAELPPTSWVAEHLRLGVEEWGERVLPELFRLMATEDTDQFPYSWVRRRSDRCALTLAEEASLRRLAAILRAEGAELGSASQVGANLDRWGIRLALQCESPPGMRRV